MTNFRSRQDGSHYPISRRKSTGSMQKSTVHLGKPKKHEYRYGVQYYDSRHGVWNVLYYPKKSDAMKQAKQMKIHCTIKRMDQNGNIKEIATIKPHTLPKKTFERSKTFNTVEFTYPKHSEKQFMEAVEDEVRKGKTVTITETATGLKAAGFRLLDKNGKLENTPKIVDARKSTIIKEQKLAKSLSADIKDESAAGPDYRKEADKLDKAGYPIQADELRHIARQEDDHKKILTEVKKDVDKSKNTPKWMQDVSRKRELDDFMERRYKINAQG